jgi:regulator of sigma E protease
MPLIAELSHFLLVGVVFLTMISVLVAAHELGHYLFARLFGMGVEEFAIGFGSKPLFTWHRRHYTVKVSEGQAIDSPSGEGFDHTTGGLSSLEGRSDAGRIEVLETPEGTVLRERTDFTVRPFLVGGFVRIKGMLPQEDGSETRIAGGFYSKPAWQRLVVLFGGPLFSVLAGIAILVPLNMSRGVVSLKNEPVFGTVIDGGAAAKAGLREGDRILTVDQKPIATFYEFVSIVRDRPDQELAVSVQREGKTLDFKLTPKKSEQPTVVFGPGMKDTGKRAIQGVVGAASLEVRDYSFGTAMVTAWQMPVEAVSGIARIFVRPQEFEQNVGGVGTMVAATNAAVKFGVPAVLMLSALLSISVGIFNLLPTPPLDGGQMMIAIAEIFRGQRLSYRVQTTVGAIGMIFVFLLIGSALVVDFKRLVVPKPAVERTE